MSTTTKTPEQIQKSINAAFDSVNIINQTILEVTTVKTLDNVQRNIAHCELMLTLDWFVNALVGTQKNDIEAAIVAGKAYIN